MDYEAYQYLSRVIGAVGIEVIGSLALRRLDRLYRNLKVFRSQIDVERIIRIEAARSNPDLINFLKHYLKIRSVKILGTPAGLYQPQTASELAIPVCLISKAPDLVLAEFDDFRVHRNDRWEDCEYIGDQKRMGRTIDDNLVYEAKRIEIDDRLLEIHPGLTTYGSALSTQDYLEWELLDTISSFLPKVSTPSDYEALIHRLDSRRQIEESTDNYLLERGTRHNAIAISTQIIYKSPDGDYRLLFGKRSSETGAHADLFHVIPACMFQPELAQIEDEWDVLLNVLKEYGEELFSEDYRSKAVVPQHIYEWSSVKSLHNELSSGSCEFLISGVAISLMNLRPEILCVLLIHDSNWWEGEARKMKMNWEYAALQDVFEVHGMARSDFHLDEFEDEFLNYFGASPGMWVAPGLAALWLGAEVARSILRS